MKEKSFINIKLLLKIVLHWLKKKKIFTEINYYSITYLIRAARDSSRYLNNDDALDSLCLIEVI